jgi:hypothetical protein
MDRNLATMARQEGELEERKAAKAMYVGAVDISTISDRYHHG